MESCGSCVFTYTMMLSLRFLKLEMPCSTCLMTVTNTFTACQNRVLHDTPEASKCVEHSAIPSGCSLSWWYLTFRASLENSTAPFKAHDIGSLSGLPMESGQWPSQRSFSCSLLSSLFSLFFSYIALSHIEFGLIYCVSNVVLFHALIVGLNTALVKLQCSFLCKIEVACQLSAVSQTAAQCILTCNHSLLDARACQQQDSVSMRCVLWMSTQTGRMEFPMLSLLAWRNHSKDSMLKEDSSL